MASKGVRGAKVKSSDALVRLVQKSTPLSQRYAAGNFGHIVLENVVPVVKAGQAIMPGFTLRDLQVLVLDDCEGNANDYESLWG
jgi:hypothetical protein